MGEKGHNDDTKQHKERKTKHRGTEHESGRKRRREPEGPAPPSRPKAVLKPAASADKRRAGTEDDHRERRHVHRRHRHRRTENSTTAAASRDRTPASATALVLPPGSWMPGAVPNSQGYPASRPPPPHWAGVHPPPHGPPGSYPPPSRGHFPNALARSGMELPPGHTGGAGGGRSAPPLEWHGACPTAR